jgi:hypothetical protein
VQIPVGFNFPQNITDPTIVHAIANKEYIIIIKSVAVPQHIPAVMEQQELMAAIKSKTMMAILR